MQIIVTQRDMRQAACTPWLALAVLFLFSLLSSKAYPLWRHHLPALVWHQS